jgi:hypothetical protein
MPFICLYRVTRYHTTIQQTSISACFLKRSIQIISHHCVGILFITSSNYHEKFIFLSNGQSQKQHTAQTSTSHLYGTLNYVYLLEYIGKAGSSSTSSTSAPFPPPLQPSRFFLYASFSVLHFLTFLSLFVCGFDHSFLL